MWKCGSSKCPNKSRLVLHNMQVIPCFLVRLEVCLVNSVLTALPLYYISFFKVPGSVIGEGFRVRFWLDKWAGPTIFAVAYLRILINFAHQHSLIAELGSWTDRGWKLMATSVDKE
uniref:Uncharacterized protein n=1 Tax=Cajanus cajan TaxID=3821 RepID=A0A151RIC8_CAJCA|nr:hypothetical protein KK1_036227 [Cajanus cajan]